jgi:taurine dioxygenase
MYGAYDRLSSGWRARIKDLRAVHNLDFSRTRRHGIDLMTDEQKREKPPVDQPIVRTHPETGRKCIYLGDHAEYIVGMPYDEGRALIEELNALAVHPDLTYEHRWKPGELIAWDNRCVMHRATAYDPATQGPSCPVHGAGRGSALSESDRPRGRSIVDAAFGDAGPARRKCVDWRAQSA